MTTTTAIASQYNVTVEQLDKAHRILDMSTGQTFYLVESASEPGTEYKVSYLAEKKALVCTCKAGQNGTPCWHKRAALADAAIVKAETLEKQEQERQVMERPIKINPDCEAMISRLEAVMSANAANNLDWRKQCYKATMKR